MHANTPITAPRLAGLLLLILLVAPPLPARAPQRLLPPPAGKLYHGVFPGGTAGLEDAITAQEVASYAQAVNAWPTWVYFSSEWGTSRAFPRRTAEWIRRRGAIPYIRLMLRTAPVANQPEPLFTLPAILAGAFDADLVAWGREAARFRTPILIEWGTECNGRWFSWNGSWHGGATPGDFGSPTKADGPERFVAVFRHLVTTLRGAGAHNLVWVFHVAAADDPAEEWNRLEAYYPGDDVVDWIGVSLYGQGSPLDPWPARSFRAQLDDSYPRLERLAPHKPIIIAEFGTTANHPTTPAGSWTRAALNDLLGGRWPRVIGLAWWNSHFSNDADPAHDTIMRVQESPALRAAFREQFTLHRPRLQLLPRLTTP
jgi:hypothetical protein